MQETRVRSLGREDPLEKEMATHSSILAWRIPWTEELGGLQCTGHKESDTTERLHFHFSLACIGDGNGNPLQYSCLENSMDRGAWWATVHGSQRVGHDLATDAFTLYTILVCKGLAQLIPKCKMIRGKSGRFWGHR